jgi:hypothetical protein
MLAEFLIFIEGKERDITRVRFGDLAADHGAILVGDEFRQV